VYIRRCCPIIRVVKCRDEVKIDALEISMRGGPGKMEQEEIAAMRRAQGV